MKQRVITATIALLIFIPLVIYGKLPFEILCILLGLIGLSEIYIMRKKLLVSPEAMIGSLAGLTLLIPEQWLTFLPDPELRFSIFYFFILIYLLYTVVTRNRFSFDDAGFLTLGVIYISVGFHYLIVARQAGLDVLFLILFVVWATDSGAYMVGRKFGKNKLAPHISPNKTWEGTIGGSVIALIVGAVFTYFFPQVYSWGTMLLVILLASVAGQLGDLVESALKRYYGVKDSGKILPGHGGILDRFDSLLVVLPIMHFVGLI
ncbi:CDP-diglyceride synthetase [Liquorilactobacillus aquaticus DSM 21051]|uniref:Phosphatidate cytidylyltransferase n=2 Tax=Liquorilactobacillus TaxID=2767888 RepID=A0A0R2CWX6_9LACO|nr:phosphatidate cytidylyltransferase [Liquorilactobacillus aquaticus]KRM96415.1 CDP-diglyceride synthetase [Liquorilactobacillus aquaticus DSM 21051]